MKLNGRQVGVLVWALLALLAASGCTGSDPLTPGSGNFETTLDFRNISGRFVDNPFDAALLTYQQIEVHPTDPVADTNVGALLNLGLLRDEFRANFVSADPRSEIIGLTSGEYRLVRMVLSQLTLRDLDDLTVAGLSDPVNPVCSDFVKQVGINATMEVFDRDLDEEVRRSLDADNPGSLNLVIDYEAFLAAVFASINCASCNCPSLYSPNVIPRSCSVSGSTCSVDADCPQNQTCDDCTCAVTLNSFDDSNFVSLTSTYLSFE